MFGIFNTTTIPALEQTLTFSQKRHELLAGNLANLDTPGYRAKDLDVGDFQNALAESIDLHKKAIDSGKPLTRDDIRSGPRVSLEQQVSEVAKNEHMHALAITTMRSQFALLRAAITERA